MILLTTRQAESLPVGSTTTLKTNGEYRYILVPYMRHVQDIPEFAYLIWMELQMACVFALSSLVDPNEFLSFMDGFPEMQSPLTTSIALNRQHQHCFINIVVVFLATLLGYIHTSIETKPAEWGCIFGSRCPFNEHPLGNPVVLLWCS